MFDLSKPSKVWIRTNTKAGLDRTGIAAVVTLCYDSEPESRIALWYAKNGDGEFEFMSPTVPIETPDGSMKSSECLFGGIADDLIKAAQAAQAKLKKELGNPKAGKLYRIADKAEEIKRATL